MATKSPRLENIQAVRALAALMVVFAHIDLPRYRSVGIQPDVFGFGAIGVDIFFAISGFIMMYVSVGKSGLGDGLRFLRSRILRVWPLYMFFTAITVWLAYESPRASWLSQYYPQTKLGLQWIFESVSFTHWHQGPVYAIGWTLIYEFWFYVSVALFIAIKARRDIFFGGMALLVVIVHLMGLTSLGMFNTIASPLMIEFVFGVILFHLFRTGRLEFSYVKAGVFGSLGLFLFLLYNFTPTILGWYSRTMVWGVAGFCLVAFALVLQGRFVAGKILVLLGDASYSLYLTHWLVVTTLPSLIDIYGFSKMGPAVYIGLNVAVSLLLALAVYFGVEKPLRSGAKWLQQKPNIVAPAQ
jgi:exopolysaccharide production protein ExoZ